ncbi:MAG: preprotein translocase subunit YajC [Acetatifactor sp.]|nr:preprotein translocase subunit YajC [Acetatifactor sp.]MDE5950156.1 preprotein translocase subunit YajC [Acetatifactor sp.]
MGILLTGEEVMAEQSGMGSLLYMFLIYGLVFVVIYFILFRPQKKEQKRVQSMLAALEIGDSVLTTAGFYGVIIDIPDDTTVIVEFGSNKNCRIPMEKSAISRVEKAAEQ